MKENRKAVVAAVVALFAVEAAAAPLSLDAAMKRAMEANPEVAQAEAEVQAARARLENASQLVRDNPTLSAAAGPRSAGGDSALDLEVELSQPLEIAGQRGARVSQAEAALRAATSLLANRRADVAARTAGAFFGALAAEDRVRAAADALAFAQESLTAAQERMRAGAATRIDVNAALLELGRAQRALLTARQALRRERADLALLLAVEGEEALVLEGTLEENAARLARVVPEVEEAVRTALARRADLEAGRAALESARAGASVADRSAFPTPSLSVGYAREGDEQVVRGGLAFDLPLFDRNQEERGVARARVLREEASVAALERRIRREVSLASQRLRAAREVVEAFQRDINAAAAENVSLVQEGYRAGKLDLFQLLLIQRDAIEARVAYIDALEELAAATIRLGRVTGTLADAPAGREPSNHAQPLDRGS